MSGKSRAQLEHENEILRHKISIGTTDTIVSGLVDAFKKLCVWIPVSLLGYYAMIVGVAWAGKNTNANINLNANINSTTNSGDDATLNAGTLAAQALTGDMPGFIDFISTAAGWAPLNIFVFLFFLAYAARERKLRRDTIARLSTRIQELESEYDSNRTTSGLNQRGLNNQRDR